MSQDHSWAEIALATLLSIAGVVSYWYVGPILWGWFVVPLGVPAVTWQHFAGLSLLRGLMLYRYKNRRDEELMMPSVHSATIPWLALFFGWIFA